MKKNILFIIVVAVLLLIGFLTWIFIEGGIGNIYAKSGPFFTAGNNLYAKDNVFPFFYKISNSIQKPVTNIQGLFVKDQKNIYFAHCPGQVASGFDTSSFDIYTGSYFSGKLMVQDKNAIYIISKTGHYGQVSNSNCKYPGNFTFSEFMKK